MREPHTITFTNQPIAHKIPHCTFCTTQPTHRAHNNAQQIASLTCNARTWDKPVPDCHTQTTPLVFFCRYTFILPRKTKLDRMSKCFQHKNLFPLYLNNHTHSNGNRTIHTRLFHTFHLTKEQNKTCFKFGHESHSFHSKSVQR